MALIDTIQRLHQQNWSQRRITLELEIDRETVFRYRLRTLKAMARKAESLGYKFVPATAE